MQPPSTTQSENLTNLKPKEDQSLEMSQSGAKLNGPSRSTRLDTVAHREAFRKGLSDDLLDHLLRGNPGPKDA